MVFTWHHLMKNGILCYEGLFIHAKIILDKGNTNNYSLATCCLSTVLGNRFHYKCWLDIIECSATNKKVSSYFSFNEKIGFGPLRHLWSFLKMWYPSSSHITHGLVHRISISHIGIPRATATQPTWYWHLHYKYSYLFTYFIFFCEIFEIIFLHIH